MLKIIKNLYRYKKRPLAFMLIFVLASVLVSQLYLDVWASQKTDVKIVDVAVGSYHSMAIDDEGRLWVWGENAYGKLGQGISGGVYNSPRQITQAYGGETLPPIVQISGSYQNTLLLDRSGSVWTAGTGELNANGNGSLLESNLFRRVDLGGNAAVDISSRHLGGAAVTADGHIWVWGRNYDYSGGLGNANFLNKPTMITTGTKNTGSPFVNGGDKSNYCSVVPVAVRTIKRRYTKKVKAQKQS